MNREIRHFPNRNLFFSFPSVKGEKKFTKRKCKRERDKNIKFVETLNQTAKALAANRQYSQAIGKDMWGGGTGLKCLPRTFPPSRTTYMPNFIKIRRTVGISKENIHIHCLCPPGGLKWKNKHLLKFNFREIVFYNIAQFSKKLPPPGPATLDLGPK